MRNLHWFQAAQLARLGRPVRRESWRKWLSFQIALWFIDRRNADDTGDLHYVVPNQEFQAAEFAAFDWTDEPWPGFPDEPPYEPPGVVIDGGGHWWGGPGNPPGGGSVVQPPYPPFVGGGGNPGGGGGGVERPRVVPPHNPPAGQTPTVTVVLDVVGDLPGCYDPLATPPTTVEMSAEITITGGPAGVGGTSVELGGVEKLIGGWPGMNQGVTFGGVNFILGGTLTCTATYTINSIGYTGSDTFTFPDVCGSSGGAPGP